MFCSINVYPFNKSGFFGVCTRYYNIFHPKAFSPQTKGKTPFTPLILPSNESSPKKAVSFETSESINPFSIKTPIAIGRSKWVPSFFISAGAGFITTLRTGNVKPEFLTALLTRSFDSLTAVSGKPTIETLGKELDKIYFRIDFISF